METMTKRRTTYEGLPCDATATIGGTEMTCVLVDCDGVHHYFMAYTP